MSEPCHFSPLFELCVHTREEERERMVQAFKALAKMCHGLWRAIESPKLCFCTPCVCVCERERREVPLQLLLCIGPWIAGPRSVWASWTCPPYDMQENTSNLHKKRRSFWDPSTICLFQRTPQSHISDLQKIHSSGEGGGWVPAVAQKHDLRYKMALHMKMCTDKQEASPAGQLIEAEKKNKIKKGGTRREIYGRVCGDHIIVGVGGEGVPG